MHDERARLLAGHVEALALRARVSLPAGLPLLHTWGPPADVRLTDAEAADPDLLSKVDARLLGRDARRRGGVFHTPWAVAQRLVADVVTGPVTVCDPACGTGTLLLAAAEAGAATLVGFDVDPVAAAVTEARLALRGRSARTLVGDGTAVDERFDVVVANPPFVDGLHVRFLAWAARAAPSVAIVLPASTLATDEASRARAAVHAAGGRVERVWRPGDVFVDASVDTCVVVIRPGIDPGVGDGTWSRHLAAAVPSVRLDGPRLDEWCDVVNGFRQHYYGLRGAVREGGTGAPLVTSGAIEPGRWGGSLRFDGRRYDDARVTVVDIADERVRAHYESLLRPKVVLATQTRVLEAAADPGGEVVPGVPVLSVLPHDPARLWHALAVLLAPPVTAHAMRTWGGAALAADAVKLSAPQVRAIPCPSAAAPAWDEAAAILREGGPVHDAGARMCAAYDVGEEVLDWWVARLR